MTQRADCSLIHHTGSPVPLGFPLSCPSHLALRQHYLVFASINGDVRFFYTYLNVLLPLF